MQAYQTPTFEFVGALRDITLERGWGHGHGHDNGHDHGHTFSR